ncbi:uncharacterized protein LOC135682021 [Rhopilema esculentum]|uniref:uncharacterized protein LOC135682021 n=1 Tax=Rhopilema esculentum TaxID=499914 RepID=UPI0031D64EE1
MLLIQMLLVFAVLAETYGQFFPRFGFEFPGFSAPEAFEDTGFADIQDRIASLLTDSKKPKKGIKTKVKTERKGDENITTIEQKGKDFDSWAKITTFGDEKKKGKKSFSKIISSLFGGGLMGKSDKKSECSGQKPCKGDKYCDPVEGVCKDKASEGERCFMKDQCKGEKGIVCIWGRCSAGQRGQSGTFCKKDGDCANDNFCTEDPQISVFHPICKPKLDEGASCGSINPFGMLRIAIGKRDLSAQKKLENPCKSGLKCEPVGLFGGMVCVPETLKIKKEEEKKEKKKPVEDDDEDEEEESSGKEDGESEKPDNEEGGDIVPSNAQKEPEDQPTNINNAKPGNDKSKNKNPTGIAQTGQQKPPSGQDEPPIPALKPGVGVPGNGPTKSSGGKQKKNKKKKERKEKDE